MGNTIAKVTIIGPLPNRPPYGNPEVIATVFDIHTGLVKNEQFVIDAAGTYKTWRWVQPPEWSSEAPFDPKAGRIVLDVPFDLNKEVSARGARWADVLNAWWIAEEDQAALKKIADLGIRVAE